MHGKQQQNLWRAQEGQAVTSRHRTATFKATLLPTTASLFIKTLRDAALKGPLKRQSNCCTMEALPSVFRLPRSSVSLSAPTARILRGSARARSLSLLIPVSPRVTWPRKREWHEKYARGPAGQRGDTGEGSLRDLPAWPK